MSKDRKTICMLHPLTGARIPLPSPILELENMHYTYHKFVLSSSPSLTSDYTIMLSARRELQFFRPGHSGHWSRVSINTMRLPKINITYCKGQFYAINYRGGVFVCDIDQDFKKAGLRVVALEIPIYALGLPCFSVRYYLVESAGTLLMALLLYSSNSTAVSLRVFEVPLDDGSLWIKSEITDLGNRTLFLGGQSSSFSVEASGCANCRPNCIYVMADRYNGLDGMVILHMEDGKLEQKLGKSFDIGNEGALSKYVWIQPSF